MVELRKRPNNAPSEGPQPPRKKPNPTAQKSNAESSQAASSSANGTEKASKIAVGDIIDLDGFGGEVETQDGQKTNLKKLVEESKNGVVLFTYPKASTPGCKSTATSSVDVRVCLGKLKLHHDRHYPGMPVQRSIYTTHGYRLFHLRLVD